MKNLNFDEMEMVQGGWSTASFICSAGFGGYEAIVGFALATAGVSAGATLAFAIGVTVIGAAVCAAA